jgi:hypothetical protein
MTSGDSGGGDLPMRRGTEPGGICTGAVVVHLSVGQRVSQSVLVRLGTRLLPATCPAGLR